MNILLNLNEGKFPIKINDSYDPSFIEEVHIIDLVIVSNFNSKENSDWLLCLQKED